MKILIKISIITFFVIIPSVASIIIICTGGKISEFNQITTLVLYIIYGTIAWNSVLNNFMSKESDIEKDN